MFFKALLFCDSISLNISVVDWPSWLSAEDKRRLAAGVPPAPPAEGGSWVELLRDSWGEAHSLPSPEWEPLGELGERRFSRLPMGLAAWLERRLEDMSLPSLISLLQ